MPLFRDVITNFVLNNAGKYFKSRWQTKTMTQKQLADTLDSLAFDLSDDYINELATVTASSIKNALSLKDLPSGTGCVPPYRKTNTKSSSKKYSDESDDENDYTASPLFKTLSETMIVVSHDFGSDTTGCGMVADCSCGKCKQNPSSPTSKEPHYVYAEGHCVTCYLGINDV